MFLFRDCDSVVGDFVYLCLCFLNYRYFPFRV